MGWEGLYDVSDLGRVKSLERRVRTKGNGTRLLRERILKLSVTRDGYAIVKLCRDGRARSMTVHSLVLIAFIGPRPTGLEACHRDGNKVSNALSNLRWDTKKANELDAVRLGTRPDPNRRACSRGHEFTPANTYFTKAKPRLRQCKKCLSIYNARARAKRKAA